MQKFVTLLLISTIHILLSRVSNIYSPFYPLFSCHTFTLVYRGKLSISSVLSLLHILRALLTYCLAFSFRTLVITLQIAIAQAVINRDRGDVSESYRYVPNMSNIGTNLLDPVVSLIALTAICSIISSFVSCPYRLAIIILNTYCKRVW
jgi:hypothetical protein